MTTVTIRIRIGLPIWLAMAVALLTVGTMSTASAAFDQGHAAWNSLLRKHVVVTGGGSASRVNYAGMQQDRAVLQAYLDTLTQVSRAEYDGWSKPQRMAFLINAYNAFTVELILTKYPDLQSIKDLGGLFGSPWKKKFFKLLGEPMSLDGIEHDILRKRGAFDDPRVHFAVNCASIGCPMLREEVFVADRLDAQLANQALRFMSDRTRNRYDAKSGKLEVSSIFDWYGDDFRAGFRGWKSPADFFADYARSLASDAGAQKRVSERDVPIEFLNYDWKLNDVRP
ncbi:MAG: DUF547 domain-containing protein [Casimicrobiaceae bacterium]